MPVCRSRDVRISDPEDRDPVAAAVAALPAWGAPAHGELASGRDEAGTGSERKGSKRCESDSMKIELPVAAVDREIIRLELIAALVTKTVDLVNDNPETL
jgi:hypothetical protein